MFDLVHDRADQFLGRDDEVALVEALVDREGTEHAMLMLEGPAGIGKSALLDLARRRAAEKQIQTLATDGVEAEAELAFGGLHQLLLPIDRYIDELPPGQRHALEAAFGISEDDEADPFHVLIAAYELVAAAADAAPLLMVIDDAQWLDPSSQAALVFVARRLRPGSASLIAAKRTGFETLLDEAHLPTVRLGPLSGEDADRLLDSCGPHLHPLTRDRVLGEAEGNPLALIELAKAACPNGASADESLLAPMALTERLRRTFSIRLADLPEETRGALLLAALDREATLEEIGAACGRVGAETAGASALDPPVAAGLIAADLNGVHFTHPLIRTVVSASALPTELRAAHGALADAVEDPERRLWHEAQATVEPDAELADALARQAEAARRRGSMIDAVAAMERSATLTPDPETRAERVVVAAEIAHEAGLVDQVRSLLADVDPTDLPPRTAARVEWLRLLLGGDPWDGSGAARDFARIAERIAADGDPDLALRSLLPVADRIWWTGSPDRTRKLVAEAAARVAAAESPGRSRELVADAAARVGTDPDDARLPAIRDFVDPEGNGAAVDDARLLAIRALVDPERYGPAVAERLSAHPVGAAEDASAEHHLGIAAAAIGDFVDADRRLAVATDRLTEQGHLALLPQALVHLSRVRSFRGDWRAAADAGLKAAELSRDTQQPTCGLIGEVMASLATATGGDGEAVERILAAPEAALVPRGEAALLAPARIARGMVALVRSDHEEAFYQLSPVFDQGSPDFHRFIRWTAVFDLVEAAVGSGNEAAAREVLAELEPGPDEWAPPVLLAGLACARPLLADADAEESDELFAAALAHDLSGYPMLRARALFAHGRSLHRHRHNAEARGPLRAAITIFDALGARAWSERASQDLRAAGDRRPPCSVDRDRLTPQELRIAEAAALGLTNREIASRLFVSPRTVGSHLSNVFRKLGISSRAQLRDALGEADRERSNGRPGPLVSSRLR
jgi:DNA-binding CsgD family transcriptional regulator